MITPDLLIAATGCRRAEADLYAQPLWDACARFGIVTPARLAAFLGQLGHESGSLRWAEEIWGPTDAQKSYEGRTNLGNIYPGDGEKYKGRGLIQVTGRSNYQRARDGLRAELGDMVPDFESMPAELASPSWACWSAAHWWAQHGCNELADAGEVVKIGRCINRGNANATAAANGEADRLERTQRAQAALADWSEHGAMAEPVPELTAPPAPVAPPSKETRPMLPLIPALIPLLANTLIDLFSPLAKEKIRSVLERKGTPPAVIEQINVGVVETAKRLTGLVDPVQATAAMQIKAQAEPEALAEVESDALATLERLMPVLNQVQKWEESAWAASEASMAAAAARTRGDPHAEQIDTYLTHSIVKGNWALLGLVAMLLAAMAWVKAPNEMLVGLLAFFVGIGTTFKDKLSTRYDHAYGSSRTSGAKDAVISELSRRPESKP